MLTAVQDIQSGHEITISYGNHNAEVFLLNYFFVPDLVAQDECLFLDLFHELKALPEDDPIALLAGDTEIRRIAPFGYVPIGPAPILRSNAFIAERLKPDAAAVLLELKAMAVLKTLEVQIVSLTLSVCKRGFRRQSSRQETRTCLFHISGFSESQAQGCETLSGFY